MAKREIITVSVSQRILRIGAAAYPVNNIARVQTLKAVPDVGAAVWSFVKAVFLWVLLGIGAVVALKYGGVRGTVTQLQTVPLVIMGALILISFIVFIARVSGRPLYALIIETSGSPRTALVNPDGKLVTSLSMQITHAINDPYANFTQSVTNYVNIGDHYGDNINQSGIGNRVSK
jgi:hypothetical protein